MERVTGIEPAYFAWEANVLPLNYTRLQRCGALAKCPAAMNPIPKTPSNPL
jgi:hypothetical protein